MDRANPRKSNVAINVAAVSMFIAVGMLLAPDGGLVGVLWLLAYLAVYWLAIEELIPQMGAVGWLP